jgi:hypothetical protein
MASSKDNPEKPKKSAPPAAKDALGQELAQNGDKIRIEEAARSLFTKASALAAGALGVAVVLGMGQGDGFKRFSHAYLTAYMWALTLGLGGLYWVTLQHLVNSKWSTVLRRLGELLANTLPVLGVLALPIVIPVLLGNDTLYAWANHERVHADHLLHHKAKYLNATFFLIRFVFYFVFWTLLARFYLKSSLEQDKSGAPADIRLRMQRVAGPGMIVFALALTFCAVDFLMTLEPNWFSTIFGVYYFASCVLAVNSTLVLLAKWLHKHGRLTKSITVEHFHDLGKMMFAFTVFWAYVGFSQFMLMWYANVPEETFWWKERFAGGWGDYSWAMLVLHFVVPFFGLLSRHVKRHGKALVFWAVWILVVIYLDMYWLVMPTISEGEVPFALVDVLCWVGLGSAIVAVLAYRAQKLTLIPVKDPQLPRSLAFENI